MKEAVGKVLKEEGYVADVRTTGMEESNPKMRMLHVYLRYDEDRHSIIKGLKRVSRPGRRIFRGVSDLDKVLDGLGVSILSTSRGIMSDRKARKDRVGGEVICKVW